MIDIHSHILPGLDDGSNSMEQSLAMVRQLYEAGFQTLIATPHVLEGRDYLSPEEILVTTDQVRTCVAEAGIPVEILPGAENYIFPDLIKWVREGKLMTLGNTGKYLLVELPMLEIPLYTDQVFFELQVEGLTPILAHPERNRGLVENPVRLLDWASRGILFQLDLRSLNGKYGPQAQELAHRLLHSELIHLIGSDAHRVARSITPYLEALHCVKNVVGEERFKQVTLSNPKAILDGKLLQSEGDRDYFFREPVITKKKVGFRIFF